MYSLISATSDPTPPPGVSGMALFSTHNVNLLTETLSVDLGTAGAAWGDLQGGLKFI